MYLAYHKPVGITCTTEPDVRGNIVEAIGYPERIFPIGRLDKDSSGLILLTNDGDIVNRILRAEFGHEREYLVTVDRPYPPSFLDRLERGVLILGKKTSPCRAYPHRSVLLSHHPDGRAQSTDPPHVFGFRFPSQSTGAQSDHAP